MTINWKAHGVGPRFTGAELDQIDSTYFQDVHEYAKLYQTYLQAGRGLLLSGSVGSGKSYATVALMKRMREEQDSRFDFYFITAPDLFEFLDDKNSVDTYRMKKWVDVFSTIPALVINDLGKEERTAKGALASINAKLGRLLRKRHEAMLPIFVTTNLPIVASRKHNVRGETVQSVYGTSIWSLLYEMTEFRAQVNAPDRRIPNARVPQEVEEGSAP